VAGLNVAGKLRKDRLLMGLLAAFVLIIAYAWHNGGRETVHPIVEPVNLPGATK